MRRFWRSFEDQNFVVSTLRWRWMALLEMLFANTDDKSEIVHKKENWNVSHRFGRSIRPWTETCEIIPHRFEILLLIFLSRSIIQHLNDRIQFLYLEKHFAKHFASDLILTCCKVLAFRRSYSRSWLSNWLLYWSVVLNDFIGLTLTRDFYVLGYKSRKVYQ